MEKTNFRKPDGTYTYSPAKFCKAWDNEVFKPMEALTGDTAQGHTEFRIWWLVRHMLKLKGPRHPQDDAPYGVENSDNPIVP